jgi:hypothetical protein
VSSNTITQGFHQPRLNVVSVQQISKDIIIKIFPNPSETSLFITFKGVFSNLDISVVDINGKVVKNIRRNNQEKLEIPCTDLSTGTYIIAIKNDKGNSISNYKFIKL